MRSYPVARSELFARHLGVAPFVWLEERQAAEPHEVQRGAQDQQQQDLARGRKGLARPAYAGWVGGAQCLKDSVRLGFSDPSALLRAGTTSSDWKLIRFFFIQRTA